MLLGLRCWEALRRTAVLRGQAGRLSCQRIRRGRARGWVCNSRPFGQTRYIGGWRCRISQKSTPNSILCSPAAVAFGSTRVWCHREHETELGQNQSKETKGFSPLRQGTQRAAVALGLCEKRCVSDLAACQVSCDSRFRRKSTKTPSAARFSQAAEGVFAQKSYVILGSTKGQSLA